MVFGLGVCFENEMVVLQWQMDVAGLTNNDRD